MNKSVILLQLEELGFSIEQVDEDFYFFDYEELKILYMPDNEDDSFLRFAIPYIYDVTEENKPFVLEVVNDTNLAIKYSKTCVYKDTVWIFYEHRIFEEVDLGELLEHTLMLLKATYYLFHRKIEGDDTFPYDDDGDNNETEEEENDE